MSRLNLFVGRVTGFKDQSFIFFAIRSVLGVLAGPGRARDRFPWQPCLTHLYPKV